MPYDAHFPNNGFEFSPLLTVYLSGRLWRGDGTGRGASSAISE